MSLKFIVILIITSKIISTSFNFTSLFDYQELSHLSLNMTVSDVFGYQKYKNSFQIEKNNFEIEKRTACKFVIIEFLKSKTYDIINMISSNKDSDEARAFDDVLKHFEEECLIKIESNDIEFIFNITNHDYLLNNSTLSLISLPNINKIRHEDTKPKSKQINSSNGYNFDIVIVFTILILLLILVKKLNKIIKHPDNSKFE